MKVRLSLVPAGILVFVGVACGPSTAAQRADVDAGVAAAVNLVQAQGRWNGSITVSQNASHQLVEDDGKTHKSTSNQSVAITATITVVDGKAAAIVKYFARDETETIDTYDQHTVEGKVTEITDASGVSNDARFNVTIYDDGRFLIEYGARGVNGHYTKNEVSVTRCSRNAVSCKPSSSSNSDSAQPKNLGGVGGTIHGKVDPANANALAGSMSEPASLLGSGPPGRSVVSWTLKR